MKLPKLIALHYGLAAILVISSVSVLADSPKNEAIDYQQKQAKEGIDAAEKAIPLKDDRPAVTTKKSLKPKPTDGKDALIESQELEAAKSMKDAEAAKPVVENRPAVTTKKSLHPETAVGKELIKSQKSTN